MQTTKKVSLLGLGQMGRKLAQLYTDAGFEVTVWNRTKSRADGLKNVIVAECAADAIASSPLTIICVYDNAGVFGMLGSIIDDGIFAGKTIVNLTTGNPKEASALENLIAEKGGAYLNGAIQVAPDQMGLERTTILMGGTNEVFQQHKPALDVLGGTLKWLGEKVAAASAMDLATLTWLYGSYMGLIYGAKLSQAYGLKLEDYSAIIGEITPGFTDFFKYEVNVISSGDFKVTQSPLTISVAATQRIADSFLELDVLQDFPSVIKNILKKADRKGLGNEELAAVIKVVGNGR